MEDRLDMINWSIAWQSLLDNSQPMSWNLFLALLPLALSCELFHRPRSPIVYGGIWLLVVITLLPNLNRLAAFASAWIAQHGLVPLLGTIAGLLAAIGLGFWWVGQQRMQVTFWWVGCLIFVLFLPNAAYVLTDSIHFVIDIRKGYSFGNVVLVLLPQYLLFISTGFQAYVASLMNLGYFLAKRGQAQYCNLLELSFHGLAAIGVYLGRFSRFNSWDVLNHPGKLWQAGSEIVTSTHSMLVILVLFGVLAICYWLCKRINIGLLSQNDVFRSTV
jgi:uncharacterized membrane protein